MEQPRHFGRGQALLIGLSAALLVVACSKELGSVGGIGGSGGATTRPTCPSGMVTFSICVVNDADMLPLGGSGGASGAIHDSIVAAAATVEAIGTGAAPAQCQNARVFGAAVSSDRWLQVRTADTKL